MEAAWDISAALLSMVFLWSTMYNIISVYFSDKKAIWCCQVLALVHTTTVLYMVYNYQMKYDAWPLANAGKYN